MRHGTRWRCPLDGNLKQRIEEMLRTIQRHAAPGPVATRIAEWTKGSPTHEETVHAPEYPATPPRCRHVRVRDGLADKSDDFTIPVAPAGLWTGPDEMNEMAGVKLQLLDHVEVNEGQWR